MNLLPYLQRIGIETLPSPTEATLFALHRNHVFHVPFENLDVQFQKKISLAPADLYHKIVDHKRGGFCYELNYLFHLILAQLGYNTVIISCRIFNSDGNEGPEYDHLAILVEGEKRWLLDVGFGDLFLCPIEVADGRIQCDSRNYFKVEQQGVKYLLSMSADGNSFQSKYTFSTLPRSIDEFMQSCHEKETDADSYFVKNLVCTKPTQQGRVTIFNNRLLITEGREKQEILIINKAHLSDVLSERFDLVI